MIIYNTIRTSTNFPIERQLAKLPDLERAQVEAMVRELMEFKGIGRLTALEIIYAVGLMLRERAA